MQHLSARMCAAALAVAATRCTLIPSWHCVAAAVMRASAFLLASAALLPLLGSHSIDVAAAQAEQFRFSPPSSPMVLSRTVFRELSGGQQVVVQRRFRVQFVPGGDGFILNGVPLDVSVEVPPSLARLGELERQRSDLGPFPIMVDGQGLIRSGPVNEDTNLLARKDSQQAAHGLIETAAMPAVRKREGEQLLSQLAIDPRTSPWPIDLFVASNGERRQHRSVALPGGDQGDIEVLLKVDKLLPCGMPASFERVITTQLAGTKRVSRELWKLEPAP